MRETGGGDDDAGAKSMYHSLSNRGGRMHLDYFLVGWGGVDWSCSVHTHIQGAQVIVDQLLEGSYFSGWRMLRDVPPLKHGNSFPPCHL